MAALVDVSGMSRKFQGLGLITEAPCGMTVLMMLMSLQQGLSPSSSLILSQIRQSSRQKTCVGFDSVLKTLLLSQVFRGNFLPMNAFVIDAFDFCRISGSREGVTAVAEMTRLTKDCADASGEIAWKIVGGTSKLGYPQLTLSVNGTVQLVCQRCLTPYAYAIDSTTTLMLGKDDEHADEIEEIINDETIDVIVGSRNMDAAALLEDEALLALPQVPKHEVCPDTSQLDALKNEKKSPFAALKDLKPE